MLIQLGDFGYSHPSKASESYISELTRALAHRGMTLVWVDGNHEDFDALYAVPVDPGNGLRKITNRIWHLPRGSRWTWGDTTWLALGGAVSVDKHRRTEGVSWWPQEQLTDADVDRISCGDPADVIIAHDAPAGTKVPGIGHPDTDHYWPAPVIAESNEHRRKVRAIVDALGPQHFWHGHYHVRYTDHITLNNKGGTATTLRVHGLADGREHWRDNLALANTNGALVRWPEEWPPWQQSDQCPATWCVGPR